MKKIKENSSFTKKSIPERIVYAVVFLLFFLYAASLLYPFFWGVLSSLKEVDEYLDSPFSFPSKWLFSNYASAFEMLKYNDANFIQMIFNSVWFTVGGTLIAGFVVCMTAYVVAKYDFKGKGFVYALSLVIMVVPVVGTLPAQYRLYNQLHITDSPLLLITYASGFGFNFIVMYGFFKSLPWGYAEAAFIDGATHFQVFWKIMLPQASACIFAISIVHAIGMWNDYMIPMLYLDHMPTLASGLYSYQTIMEMDTDCNYPVYFAGIFMSMLPMVVIYGAFHNVIMDNTATGGLKG